ncbi:MAG TPA: LysR family transcriptional regulator [Epulopiscium sp.]|nr:LysR family transcriptional regulator [Candidatus Epulonipiscium sp.]
MTHQQLEYLLKTVACGSISKAAEQLYLSQPALSKSLTNLESEFGIQILLRTPRGITLTERGREFVVSAKNVLASIDTLNATFKDNIHKKEVLSIASQQFYFIYDVLLDIYSQYDKESIHIDFLETDRGKIIENVLRSTTNIGLLVLTEMDSKKFNRQSRTKELEIHVLDRSGIFLNMGPKSPFYNRTSITYDEIEQAPSILLDAEESIKLGLSLNQEMENSPMEPSFFCNTISACYSFLKKTDMHLCSPKWIVDMFTDPAIRSIPITASKEYSYPINELVWIKRAFEPLNNIERKFIDLLEKRFNNNCPEEDTDNCQ